MFRNLQSNTNEQHDIALQIRCHSRETQEFQQKLWKTSFRAQKARF